MLRFRLSQVRIREFLADWLETLMAAVDAARESPPAVDLPTQYARELADLQAACERPRDSAHDPTQALAVELLNELGRYLPGVASS